MGKATRQHLAIGYQTDLIMEYAGITFEHCCLIEEMLQPSIFVQLQYSLCNDQRIKLDE
jgi:hypothetical protein